MFIDKKLKQISLMLLIICGSFQNCGSVGFRNSSQPNELDNSSLLNINVGSTAFESIPSNMEFPVESWDAVKQSYAACEQLELYNEMSELFLSESELENSDILVNRAASIYSVNEGAVPSTTNLFNDMVEPIRTSLISNDGLGNSLSLFEDSVCFNLVSALNQWEGAGGIPAHAVLDSLTGLVGVDPNIVSFSSSHDIALRNLSAQVLSGTRNRLIGFNINADSITGDSKQVILYDSFVRGKLDGVQKEVHVSGGRVEELSGRTGNLHLYNGAEVGKITGSVVNIYFHSSDSKIDEPLAPGSISGSLFKGQ